MPFDKAKEILESAFERYKKAEKIFVDLSGSGEPLLCLKLIFEINAFCREMSNKYLKEILVMFVTNGFLLSKETASLLQASGILFGVSLDGCKEVHDAHRRAVSGAPTFDLVINNVRAIQNRQYVGCAVTLTKTPFRLVETIEELLQTFSTISIKPVRSDKLGFDEKAVEFWNGEYLKLCDRLLQDVTRQDYKMVYSLLNGDDYFGKFILRGVLGMKAYNRCDAGSGRVSFDVFGNVWPCPASFGLDSMRLGDNWKINDESCKVMYEKSINSDCCRSCKYRYFCGGECFVELCSHSSSPNGFMCKFNQELIRLAMYFVCEISESSPEALERLYSFCDAKMARFRKDKDLERFLSENPSLSFVDGKRRYDSLNPKY
jgi:uncharacterized protein